jgi:hypothetical protein
LVTQEHLPYGTLPCVLVGLKQQSRELLLLLLNSFLCL